MTDHTDSSAAGDPMGSGGADKFEAGSKVEAVEAVAHHRHHPADPNTGIVRAKPGPHAPLAALIAGAITIVGVVLLALAIGSR